MRVKTLIASAMIAGAGLLAVPGMAMASLQECDSNNMCMWANNDFNGLIGERPGGQSNITNLSGGNNNAMNSWANRSATYAGCMFDDTGGGGDRQTMGRNSTDNNVSPLNSDEVTSWRTANGC